jgi:hypothetical protein
LSSSVGNELKNKLKVGENEPDYEKELKLLQESVERFVQNNNKF